MKSTKRRDYGLSKTNNYENLNKSSNKKLDLIFPTKIIKITRIIYVLFIFKISKRSTLSAPWKTKIAKKIIT